MAIRGVLLEFPPKFAEEDPVNVRLGMDGDKRKLRESWQRCARSAPEGDDKSFNAPVSRVTGASLPPPSSTTIKIFLQM